MRRKMIDAGDLAYGRVMEELRQLRVVGQSRSLCRCELRGRAQVTAER